jgi:hypothetical protein
MSDTIENVVDTDRTASPARPRLAPVVAGALTLAVATAWFVGAANSPSDHLAAEQETLTAVAARSEDVVEADDDAVVEPLPLVTYEVFLDRDPFTAVVPEPVTAAAATDGTPDESATVDGGTTTGDGTTVPSEPDVVTDANDDVPQGTDPGLSCTTGEQLNCDGLIVSLIEIREDGDGGLLAVIQVDTTIYEVGVGDRFAGNFAVSSITEDGVEVFYGDAPLGRMQEGERVLK